MSPNRRSVLRTGIAVTAAGAAGGVGLNIPAATAQVETNYPNTPPGGGQFTTDPNALAAAADDFGHFIHKTPKGVYRPTSASDIASVVRWAKDCRLKVAARGQGHSTFGRPMVDGGVVVDMGALAGIESVQPDRIVVGAGATWSAVIEAALAQGKTPPVLTSFIELSVGGTIAVGGIGPASHVHGMQTDNVLALEVVTGKGEVKTCSPYHNSDLFNAVRAGLGQCGIITKATLKLIPAPARVRRYQLFYPDVAALTADQLKVLNENRFQHIQGAFIPNGSGGWRFQLEGGVYYTDSAPDDNAVLAGLSDNRAEAVIADLSYVDYLNAFDGLENLLRSNGQWFNPHPWWLTFLPGSSAQQTASEILAGLTNGDVGPFGRVIYYPIKTNKFNTPLLRIPNESIIFPFNLVRIPATNDVGAAQAQVDANRALYDRILGRGGLQYPVGAIPMSCGDWRTHFGPKWTTLRNAKDRYDPTDLLTPGYDVF